MRRGSDTRGAASNNVSVATDAGIGFNWALPAHSSSCSVVSGVATPTLLLCSKKRSGPDMVARSSARNLMRLSSSPRISTLRPLLGRFFGVPKEPSISWDEPIRAVLFSPGCEQRSNLAIAGLFAFVGHYLSQVGCADVVAIALRAISEAFYDIMSTELLSRRASRNRMETNRDA